MSFSEWAKHRSQKNFTNTGSYNPADFSPSNNPSNQKENLDILSKATSIIDKMASPYANQPSNSEVEKVLRACIREITSLRSDLQKLSLHLEDSTEDLIAIHIGDETVIIDGELASFVYKKSVSDYIVRALENAMAFDNFSQNYIKDSNSND